MRWFLLFVLCSWHAGQVASAESPARAAQRLFQRAQNKYRSGDYQGAVEDYHAAYRKAPLPAFFFNIAQARRLQNETVLALAAYRRFVTLAPNHVLAAEARRLVAELEREIYFNDQLFESGLPPNCPIPRLRRPASAKPSSQQTEQTGRLTRPAAWIVGGAGLGLIALSVKFGIDARAHHQALDGYDSSRWSDAVLDRQARGERAERWMIVSGAAGAAALVTSGVLLVVSRDRETAPRVQVQPMFGRDGGLVSLTGGF